MKGGFLAVDWGTTNRRSYLIDADGTVVERTRDDRGILSAGIASFDEEVAALAARYPEMPMLLAGMIGSNRGWREAPYVETPAGLAQLAAQSLWARPGEIAIVPGVCRRGARRVDVMRGEEVQLLGAARAGLVPPTALLCQPGTHTKWVDLVDGGIADFTTAMTGEVFALLRSIGILAADLGGDVTMGPAFRTGVARGADRDLLADLFGARASRLLGVRALGDQPSYVSGVLIGNDVAARLAEHPTGTTVHLVADGALGDLYAVAIETLGGIVRRIDSDAAFVAGITAIWSTLS